MIIPKRGEVYWVTLDPTVGTEIQKSRPCVVVSNNLANERYHQVTVIPLTTQRTDRVEPFQALVPASALGAPKDSKALAEQIRTVSRLRLKRLIRRLPDPVVHHIDRAIRVHLNL